MLIGVALRIFLAIFFYGNYDQASYDIIAEIGRDGGNIFAETQRYNYAPTWSLVLTGLSYIPIPLHSSVRIFLTIIDLLISILIFKLTNKAHLAAIYFANPVSILLTGFHGQFENLAILPLLLAIVIQQRRRSIWLLFALCTLSILFKQITIFFVFAMYFHYAGSWRRALLMIIATSAVFVAAFIPYLPDGFENIVFQVFLYSSIQRPYGLGMLPFWNSLLFVGGMFVLIYIFRNKKITEKLILISLFYLILTPGMGNQYLALAIIFGSLSLNWGYIIFTLVSSLFLLGSPDNLGLNLPSVWNSVWIALVVWAFIQIKESTKEEKPSIMPIMGSESIPHL